MNSMIKVLIGTGFQKKEVITSSDATIMDICESENINISAGGVTLNGSILKPSDFEKTFNDFGISERCFIAQVVKADNAARLVLSGNAVVISSTISVDEIELLSKYDPAGLQLTIENENKDKFIDFAIQPTVDASKGCIGTFGIFFNGFTRDEGKLATLTLTHNDIPADNEKAKEFIADKYGLAVSKLEKLEALIPARAEKVKTERNELLAKVEIQ